MSTFLAGRIRAVHADPTPAALDELLVLAVQVARLEIALDEIVDDARRELARELAIETFRATVTRIMGHAR